MSRYFIEGDEIEVNEFDLNGYMNELKATAKQIKNELELLADA